MNKQQLAKKIAEWDAIDAKEKARLLELLNTKRYGLVWEPCPEDIEERLRNELPILTEVPERAIVNGDAPNHILIEGDNLEALTTLAYTHAGKIDVIYIDPPYNTGNKDFVYNDKFVDSEDQFRHSKWLSFMEKRLRIARTLLSDKGVIFISIDDNEQAQLKLLCDEVFGEKNCICQFIWEKTQHFGRQAKNFYSNNEYILCYCKNLYYNGGLNEVLVESINTNLEDAPLYNASNPSKILTFPKKSVKFNIPDAIYHRTTDTKYNLLDSVIVKDGTNKNEFRLEFKSRWAADTVINEYQKGCRFWVKSQKFAIRAIYQEGKSSIVSPKQIIFTNFNNSIVATNRSNQKVGTTEEGSGELNNIVIGNNIFNYPKPTSLINYLIGSVWNDKEQDFLKSSTILDFFAGSGTTLHATMQLNAEDGGNRRCILVTNNENGICENVTYERNRRVIQGYTNAKGEQVAGLTHNNLRYYRTGFVPRNRTAKNMRQLVALATDMLCIKEDNYNEQSLFCGSALNSKIARYFESNGHRMLVVYHEEAVPAIVKLLQLVEPREEKIKIYIFSPNGYAYNDEFADVADQVALCALPAAIYEVYQRILPKQKPAYLPEALAEMQAQMPNNDNTAEQTNMEFGE